MQSDLYNQLYRAPQRKAVFNWKSFILTSLLFSAVLSAVSVYFMSQLTQTFEGAIYMAIPMVLATVLYRAIDEYLEIGLAWSILAAILLWGLFNVIAINVYPFLSQTPLFTQVQNS